MNRRTFLASSAAAGLALMNSPVTRAAEPAGNREWIELRLYRFASAEKQQAFAQFVATALVPALGRLGIGPVGVFTATGGNLEKAGLKEVPHLYILIPFKSAEAVATLEAKLMADETYRKAGEAIWNAAMKNPAYQRIETSLLFAFEQCPTVQAVSKAESRVFQLRIYESHNEEKALKKIHMFNEGGEIGIFRKTGLNPVFFGQAIAGTRIPNLTYMVGFENEDAQKAAWGKFGADPDWVRISKDPFYKDSVSNITNLVLRPSPASQL